MSEEQLYQKIRDAVEHDLMQKLIGKKIDEVNTADLADAFIKAADGAISEWMAKEKEADE